MSNKVPFFHFLHEPSRYVPPTAYEWLNERGGLAEAKIAEEEFSTKELCEVARYEVIGETLHWVLKDEGAIAYD